MTEITIAQAVEKFAALTVNFSEDDLAKPWNWKGYKEGIRVAFFRVYEELRQLAANLASERAASGNPLTTAQRALSQHQVAHRDLQAVLLGVTDEQFDQSPAEEEWSLRDILAHIILADLFFYAAVKYNLDRQHSGDKSLEKPSREELVAISGPMDEFEKTTKESSLSEVLAYYETHHRRLLTEFTAIGESELSMPSVYWEEEPMPVQFRLHRFDSHLRQHTVQAKKALTAIDGPPSEAKRLLRLIYNALGEAEGALIGAEETSVSARGEAAERIVGWGDEIGETVGA